MSIETILIWMAIGLVAGWLASLVVGGGYGVIGDIVLGIVGAFLGGLIFRALHLHMPFRGVASTIFVAFVGAVGAAKRKDTMRRSAIRVAALFSTLLMSAAVDLGVQFSFDNLLGQVATGTARTDTRSIGLLLTLRN